MKGVKYLCPPNRRDVEYDTGPFTLEVEKQPKRVNGVALGGSRLKQFSLNLLRVVAKSFEEVEKVVEFLKAEYENVEFAVRSEPTGFYALGSREDLLQVKRELSNGDVDMRAILSRTYRVREAEPEDLVRFLARELPDLDFKHDGLEIEITGPRYRLYDFEALIDYLDSSDFYLKGWLYSRYVGPELDFSGVRWCPR